MGVRGYLISTRQMAHFQPEPCRTAYRLADSQSVLRLELQENAELVSGAISAYILSNIESLQDESDRAYVEQVLRVKAEATVSSSSQPSHWPTSRFSCWGWEYCLKSQTRL